MKKFIFILIFGIFASAHSFGQAYAVFHENPKMQLNPQNRYNHCKVSYNAAMKSTIYLELKKGDEIVASGIYDVPKASKNVVQIPLQTKNINKLQPGNNYSYNLYMYTGGRNDWTRKACKSTRINNIKMGAGAANNTSKGQKKTSMTSSLKNFFK